MYILKMRRDAFAISIFMLQSAAHQLWWHSNENYGEFQSKEEEEKKTYRRQQCVHKVRYILLKIMLAGTMKLLHHLEFDTFKEFTTTETMATILHEQFFLKIDNDRILKMVTVHCSSAFLRRKKFPIQCQKYGIYGHRIERR